MLLSPAIIPRLGARLLFGVQRAKAASLTGPGEGGKIGVPRDPLRIGSPALGMLRIKVE